MTKVSVFGYALVGALMGCGGGSHAAPHATPLPRASAAAPASSLDCAAAVALIGADSDLDANVKTLTNAYVAGCPDDAARKDLVKLLSKMQDPRTGPALAKAFSAYEPGKTDEDVTLAAESVAAMAKAGVKLDKPLVDGLWTCFTRYRPSKTHSIRGVQALHDAILAVKDPSYGDKAIAVLRAPVVSANAEGMRGVNDELEFWQTTAVQLIKELRYRAAARQLVTVLMTRSKLGLAALVKTAILRMPADAEPLLAAALDGSDPDLAKLQSDWENKGYVPIVLDVLAHTSLDSARDAIVSYLPRIDNDPNRAAAAQVLVWFPSTPALVATFKRTYAKLPPIAVQGGNDTGEERAQLLTVASDFFDASLGSWALGESAGAKGVNMLAARVSAIQSAIKLMGPGDKASVAAALTSLEASLSANERRQVLDLIRLAFKNAEASLDKCARNPACYVKVLEEPIPTTPSANWKAIKAAYMAGIWGSDQTRKDLIAHVPSVSNAGARLAMALAINHLAPKGDQGDADALDKIVEDDAARKDTEAMRGDDALAVVALMLRARAHAP